MKAAGGGVRQSAAELDGAICLLITSGHGPRVWDYGYGFFLTALDCLAQLVKPPK